MEAQAWRKAVGAALLVTVTVGQSAGPAGSSTGSVDGRGFRPTEVKLKKLGVNSASMSGKVLDEAQAYILEFRTGRDFFPDQAIEIWFAIDKGASLQNRQIVCKPFKFGTEGYRKQHYIPTKSACVARGITGVNFGARRGTESMPNMEMVNEEISCVLTFGRSQGQRIAGTVELKLPNHPKTWLKGAFVADLSGLVAANH
jgi:hypothetical protein